MQKIKNAFVFINAVFSKASTDKNLKKAELILGLGSLAILLVAFLLMALIIRFVGLLAPGLILIGLVGIFGLVGLILWGEITALAVCQACVSPAPEVTDESRDDLLAKVISSHWIDAGVFTLSMPFLQAASTIKQLFSSARELENAWMEAANLVLPIISLDDLNLAAAIARVKQVVHDNLMRFRSNFVPVEVVSRVIQWLAAAVGLASGVLVGLSIGEPASSEPGQIFLGLGAALLVSGFFTAAGITFSVFVRACYQTALYQWVRNVESARESGETEKAAPPEILRQLLSKKI